MKINILSIVKDHFKTLVVYPTKKVSMIDIFVFFVFPLLFSFFLYGYKFSVKLDFYNVSVTFFGIFIALLLNIQVAIFGIFLRKWDPDSLGSAEASKVKMSQRKALLGEINSNVSYLILISCFALFCFLIAYTTSLTEGFMPSLSVLIYVHFLLTLLMVIKRTHAIFQREYT